KRVPAPTQLDTVFSLRTRTPGWLALRVDGVAGDRSLLGQPAVGHTNAVRLLKNGAPRLSGVACGHMLDRIDALQQKLEERGNWSQPWHRDTIWALIQAARTQFGRAFTASPAGFHPVSPAGSVTRVEWTAAADPEPGDKVRYRVAVATDSTFNQPVSFWTDTPWVVSTPERPSLPGWWRGETVD